jgi:hypothetical protein
MAGRHLIAAWVAVAALLGILATSRATQTALLVGVALFGALNVRSELAHGVGNQGSGPDQRVADKIEGFVTAYGASIGYTGYWDSIPVTWETHLRVKVFPTEPCPAGLGLCPVYYASIDTWFIPRPNVRSFLLTDTRPNIIDQVKAPPRGLGRPLAKETVGEGFTVYVYNYDIAIPLMRDYQLLCCAVRG